VSLVQSRSFGVECSCAGVSFQEEDEELLSFRFAKTETSASQGLALFIPITAHAWTDGPPPATFMVAQRTLCATRS
jgi:hypothetical protein